MESRSSSTPSNRTALLDPERIVRAVPREARSAARAGRTLHDDASRAGYARFGRPLFDAAIVISILPAALAVGSLVAVANCVAFRDPRRILFVQPRVGRRGRVFQIYKFRTMREVGTCAHESWRAGNERARVTRLGRWLRNTHLDELPQILNILKGDMAVIGPRPEMVEIEAWAGEHVPGFSRRLAIKPGITGIAQITQGYTGHDVEAYAEKLAINLRYLREMSFRLDVEICLRTALWMLRGRGWDWSRARASNQRRSS